MPGAVVTTKRNYSYSYNIQDMVGETEVQSLNPWLDKEIAYFYSRVKP